ncbi:alpha/beta-hydrolase [Lactarius akahatsu]|uniref:Alpha/beta-hydrolase n=1 Tax=Lactarius akahatsu TaxID=416441 RepID=A0AAD4L9F0_9AGAM|nr:alpha/beta-hydrolase [Lactarius akahatsu]
MSQLTLSNGGSFRPLTLGEKLWLVPILLKLPFAIAVGIFRGNKGRSWSRSANVALTRYIFDHDWDIHAMHSFIGVTTSQMYRKWARSVKQEVLTDELPEGAKLHWIGPRRDASHHKVFLYFHGGGYVLPARADYFPFLHSLQKALSADVGEVGVVALEYSLAPDAPVPTQLRQANAALTHLLQKGIPPSNIVIGGDSAGGNLALQLASLLLHPLAAIPAPPTLSQPLAGAVLISPWVALNVDAPSYARNEGKDVLFSRSYKFMVDLVRPGVIPELKHHAEPAAAPADWWSGLDAVYPRILITAGEHEGLFDQIIDVSRVIEQHVKDTTTVVEPGGLHEDMIFKFAVGQGGNGQDYDAIVAFLTRSFRGAN